MILQLYPMNPLVDTFSFSHIIFYKQMLVHTHLKMILMINMYQHLPELIAGQFKFNVAFKEVNLTYYTFLKLHIL